MQQIEALVEDVEEQLFRQGGQEISSRVIGALTVERLQREDKVAYVRYASVYRDFQNLDQFIREVNEAMRQPGDASGQGRLFDD